MIFWYIFIGILIGAAIVSVSWWIFESEKDEKKGAKDKDKLDITLQDIIRLAALNTTLDVSSLIIEYKINVKIPEFYEKYQALNKHEKEQYFSELMAIFSRDKKEYVQDLLDRYSGLSTQDVLLLLMSGMQLDNKTIAQILGINMGTLKKRKTRLKSKMQPDDASLKEATED